MAPLALAMLLPTSAVQAEKYQLAMKRERKVGDKYIAQVEAESKQTFSQTLNGNKKENKKELVGSMTATVEVLGVYDDGRAKRVAVKVEKFDAKSNGKPVKLDTTQRIIATSSEGDVTYKYENGTQLSPEEADAFDFFDQFLPGQFLPAELRDTPSDKKIFKIEQPREVGTSWEADHKLMAKSLSGDKMTVDTKDIDSEFEFIEVAQFNGKKVAVIDITVVMNKLSITGRDQNEVVLSKGSAEISMAGLIPLDPTCSDGTLNVAMKVNHVGGLQGEISVDVEMDMKAEFTQIK